VDVLALENLRAAVQLADEQVSSLRVRVDEHEIAMKAARAEHELIRARVAEHDIVRATAETDLSHLATLCIETVQATLDDVIVEVEALESAGGIVPDSRVIDELDEELVDSRQSSVDSRQSSVDSHQSSVDSHQSPVDSHESPGASLESSGSEATGDWRPATDDSAKRTLSAEEAIVALKAKIERLGAVNMMAIEQFDELEARHAFLTTQRKDLTDSIAQTSEAIKRIDETTRQRFTDAFDAINRNFQEIFSTLFGGGRAGLTLLDPTDPLESGIEIIAQPPGKRLQSVQLLSGGEKALTAISLMFGMFKYKPSPFCLLDEIDAPLDDANIGRFVEMLRGMQSHTQFIVITHNRKTMEIADRLYGVTMEEPGVSKLISVQLN
jgi:chromosome segregation protein